MDSWAGTNLTNYRTSPGYAALGVDSTGTPKNSADGAFYQTVSIPANATAANLSFWYYITTNETGSTAYDYLYVTVRDSSGNLLTSVATLSNIDKTTGYVQKTFDLSPYKGQTIRIRFGATTDSLSTTTFRIDDVSIAVSYSAPSVTTSSASATSTSATLNGSVNPNGSSTNSWFEWGTSSTLSSYTQTSNQSIGSGTTSQAVSASLSGLNSSTTYYYRVAASNSAGTQQGSILSFSTQAAQITTRTLSVASSNPSSGVSITVSPNDNNGYGNGTASFTRTYNDKTSVTLSAPATASGNNFQKWQRNGSDYSTSSSTSVTMDADYTMTAVYLTPSVSYQLTTSTSPSSGGSISPNCSGGCPYNSGTSVTLTATANSGYTFSSWSGCDSTSGTTCYVTMNSYKPVTAYFTNTPDTTPPTISSTSPSSNATGVFVNAPITATFSEGMDSSTITASTFTLTDSGNNLVNGNITYSSTTATFTPSSSLSYNTTYTATITTGVKDSVGNAMQNNYSWSFTTAGETVSSQPTLSSPVTVAVDGGQQPRIKKWGNNVYILNWTNMTLTFYKSTDNGVTFSGTTFTNSVTNGEYDLCMDSNGYLYVFWESSNDFQLYIRKSTDGGSTWSSAATVASGFTWMDNPSGYFSNGTLYLLFRGYKNSNTELYLTKSTDNGSTFSAPVQVTSNSIQEEDGKIAVFGNNVNVVYYDYNSSDDTGNIYLVTSSNSGSSFGSPVQVSRTTGKSYFGPSMDVDGSGNIFIAYKDTTSDYEGDLYVAKSTDEGSSFTYALAADSTYRGQGSPILFVDGNGYVNLLWQDNRDNYTAGPAYSTVYYTRSVDGGASYETNVNIDSLGNIGNGSLYVDSDVVYLAVTDYKTSPYSTIFYKLSWVAADTDSPTTIALPGGGTYASAQSVTLTCSDGTGSGCDKIYYTTDGSEPTMLSTVYSTPISISATTTLKFFAKDLAGNSEAMKAEGYTININRNAYLMGGSIQGTPLNFTDSNVTIVTLTDFIGRPSGIATDGTNLFVSNYDMHTIHEIVISTGEVTTIAGSLGYSGSNDGTGSSARFFIPYGITTDGTNLFVADSYNHIIRKIVIVTGEVTTLAGSATLSGSTDGIGSAARFNYPQGITTDGINLYVADTNNHTIRKISISTGEVTTIAGYAGSIGSIDGIGLSARFNAPRGITTDGTNLFVTDYDAHTVRKILISNGEVTTLAGIAGYSGSEDGTGSSARFYFPWGISTDGTHLYVADTENRTIRKVVIATGEVTTIINAAGPGTCCLPHYSSQSPLINPALSH